MSFLPNHVSACPPNDHKFILGKELPLVKSRNLEYERQAKSTQFISR